MGEARSEFTANFTDVAFDRSANFESFIFPLETTFRNPKFWDSVSFK